MIPSGYSLSSHVARYTILEPLGQGGFGLTYRAQRDGDGAIVAVKQLRLERVESWKAVELFERESEVLRSLQHARIPRYIDHFSYGAHETPDTFILVQSFVEGFTLREYIRAGHRWTESHLLWWFWQMLEVCDYLHNLHPPVIHRDISPKNIIITPTGDGMLIDFGTVQATIASEYSISSTSAGTFGFSPPEQFVGRATPSSDLYGLAMTYIATLTNRDPQAQPYKGHRIDVRAALEHHQVDPRILLSLEWMTEPEPDRRPQRAQDVMARLRPIWGPSEPEMDLAQTVADSVPELPAPAGDLPEPVAKVGAGASSPQVATIERRSDRSRDARRRLSAIPPGTGWPASPGKPVVGMEACALSANGEWAIVDDDEVVSLLNLRHNTLQTLFSDHRCGRSAALSPDGRRAVVADQYTGLYFIEIDAAGVARVELSELGSVGLESHHLYGPRIVFSPDQRLIAIGPGNEEGDAIFLIEWRSRALVQTLPIVAVDPDEGRDEYQGSALAFSPDGQFLIFCTTSAYTQPFVLLYDQKGQASYITSGATIGLSQDGKLIAKELAESGTSNIVVASYTALSPLNHSPLHVTKLPPQCDVDDLIFSADGRWLVATVNHPHDEGDWVHVIDVETGELRARVGDARRGEGFERVFATQLAWDGRLLVFAEGRLSASMNGTLKTLFVYSLPDGEYLGAYVNLYRGAPSQRGTGLIINGRRVKPGAASGLGFTVEAPPQALDRAIEQFAAPSDQPDGNVLLAQTRDGFFARVGEPALLRTDLGPFLPWENPEVAHAGIANRGQPGDFLTDEDNRRFLDVIERMSFWTRWVYGDPGQNRESRGASETSYSVRTLVEATDSLTAVLPEVVRRARSNRESSQVFGAAGDGVVSERDLVEAAQELLAYSPAELDVIYEEMMARLTAEDNARQEEHQLRETARQAIAARLYPFGLDEETYPILNLLPLVEVAWADGKIQLEERQAMMGALDQLDLTDSRSLELWLVQKPSPRFFDDGLDLLLELAGSDDFPHVTHARFQELVALCQNVGEVAGGGFLGLFSKVSKSERKVLEKIKTALRVT